jgi:hypothetical protein
MGLGKALKKAVKQVTTGIKTFANDPLSKEGIEAGVGVGLAPATGGTSLAATADAGRRTINQAVKEEDAMREQAELEQQNVQTYGFKNAVELAQARKKKQEELEGREETRATGISSLIGRGKTLG